MVYSNLNYLNDCFPSIPLCRPIQWCTVTSLPLYLQFANVTFVFVPINIVDSITIFSVPTYYIHYAISTLNAAYLLVNRLLIEPAKTCFALSLSYNRWLFRVHFFSDGFSFWCQLTNLFLNAIGCFDTDIGTIVQYFNLKIPLLWYLLSSRYSQLDLFLVFGMLYVLISVAVYIAYLTFTHRKTWACMCNTPLETVLYSEQTLEYTDISLKARHKLTSAVITLNKCWHWLCARLSPHDAAE